MQLALDAAEAGRPRVENRTLWQRVHEHLREAIISGQLSPGSELGELALAEELGVSRGPVREAIGRLASEGLVTVRPRRGAVVRALSKEEFLEAYQVREALEPMAVRLAVPKLTDADFGELNRLNYEMAAAAEAGNVTEFFRANAAFHQTFFDIAGNRRLKEMYRQLLGEIDRYRLRSLSLRGNLHRSVVEHRAILRAAKARNAERAAHLVAEHIRVPLRRLERLNEEDLH